MSLHIVPCTIEQANTYVAQFHRHHGPVVSARIALACADEAGHVHGVALAGRPVARHLDDGWTLEVNRVATDGTRNACSLLYAAVWRAVRAIGYLHLVTYTLPKEGGASLRAAGWQLVGERKSHQWSNPGRPRAFNALFALPKLRWEVTTGTALPCTEIRWPELDAASQLALFESEVLS
jgi:hypothetical protein